MNPTAPDATTTAVSRLRCINCGNIADHAESLGDQLDDPLIQVTETAAEGNELAVGFSHARESTGRATSSRRLPAARSRGAAVVAGRSRTVACADSRMGGRATGAHKSTAAP